LPAWSNHMTRRSHKSKRGDQSRTKPTWRFPWIELGLLGLCAVVYFPVWHFQFVNYDDPGYITQNPDALGGLTWRSAWWALTTTHAPYWHPLTWLSHLLDVQLFGPSPGPHHVTNVCIHAMNALLVFWVLRDTTRAHGPSAFVAAVFAVHPLHVESVAWVTERKDVLSTLFALLTIAAYAAYARRSTVRSYGIILALYACALMAKPMVVTLPVLLLLLDLWPLQRIDTPWADWATTRRLILDKVPLVAMAAIVTVATVVIQQTLGATLSYTNFSLAARLANAVASYVIYIERFFVPAHLAAFYPMHAVAWPVAVACALLLILVTALVWFRAPRQPYLLVGWLWFLIGLSPVIGITQSGDQAMADRFMYLPVLGLAVMVAWLVSELTPPKAAVPIAMLVIASLTIVASKQVGYWSDSVTLWKHAAAVTASNYLAYEDLGQALREQGQLAEAETAYLQALALARPGASPFRAVIDNDLGLVAAERGQTDAAIQYFREALDAQPIFAEAHTNLANALAATKDFDGAIDHFNAAIAVDPTSAEPHLGLGNIFLERHQLDKAEHSYRRALEINSGLAEAHNGLGGAMSLEGKEQEAISEYQAAIKLRPESKTPYLNLAIVLTKIGRTADAIEYLDRVLAIDPKFEEARDLLNRIKHVEK
jgi:protein O-mannosyl-transferase